MEGRLDLTMEAVVVEEQFKELFSEKEIQICRAKLVESGFILK